MKTIKLHNWEIEALAYKRKSSIRVPLYVQPMKDETGMWHWRDCQWMDGGLGFPQSGIEDYAPVQPGDILSVENTGFRLWVRSLRVERLWDITDAAAEKEGCQGVFSGTGEAMGSGWLHSPADVYQKRWSPFISMDGKHWEPIVVDENSIYGWDANPWVLVVEFEVAGRKDEKPKEGCQYCSDKTRGSFRCDVRTIRNDDIVEDVPVPTLHCPYCGRLLTKEI